MTFVLIYLNPSKPCLIHNSERSTIVSQLDSFRLKNEKFKFAIGERI